MIQFNDVGLHATHKTKYMIQVINRHRKEIQATTMQPTKANQFFNYSTNCSWLESDRPH